jgi:hypothetical protein
MWTIYDTSNSGLPDDSVSALALEGDDARWFGTQGGVARFDGTTWTVYDTSNSGLPDDHVRAIAIDPGGVKWFGTATGGVASFDGTTWTVYDASNSGLPANWVHAITIDSDGLRWFATEGGAARFDGTAWIVYDTANSGLPDNAVRSIAMDHDGVMWFGTYSAGIASFDGFTWTVYDSTNSGLPENWVEAIVIDSDGAKWFGTGPGGTVARFDGEAWQHYSEWNSPLPGTSVLTISIEPDGTKWFGTEAGGAAAWWGGEVHFVTDNARWLDDNHWQATFDVTTVVPRGAYTVTVSGAQGTDGLEIPPDARFGFTVDYAGEITDKTPPAPPLVKAKGVEGDPTSMEGWWSASDPDSPIIGYRYAIGSAPGAADIVNWTPVPATTTTINRSGLGLVEGQRYWLAVQARNEGGLWSESRAAGFVAGQGQPTIFLPLVLRNQ